MATKTQLRWESAAHVAMGWGLGLIGQGWIFHRREMRQLPPENDASPAVALFFPGNGKPPTVIDAANKKWPNERSIQRFWGSARVLDSLKDLREAIIGICAAWPFVLAAGIAIGWGIWG